MYHLRRIKTGKMYITHKGICQMLAIGCNECNRRRNNLYLIWVNDLIWKYNSYLCNLTIYSKCLILILQNKHIFHKKSINQLSIEEGMHSYFNMPSTDYVNGHESLQLLCNSRLHLRSDYFAMLGFPLIHISKWAPWFGNSWLFSVKVW